MKRFRKIRQSPRERRQNLLNFILVAIVLDLAIVVNLVTFWLALAYVVWAWWLPIQRWERSE